MAISDEWPCTCLPETPGVDLGNPCKGCRKNAAIREEQRLRRLVGHADALFHKLGHPDWQAEPIGPIQTGTWPEHCEQRAFVAGAKWWQFHANGATAFPSEQDEMEAEAIRRYGEPHPEAGVNPEARALLAVMSELTDAFAIATNNKCPACTIAAARDGNGLVQHTCKAHDYQAIRRRTRCAKSDSGEHKEEPWSEGRCNYCGVVLDPDDGDKP